MAPAGARNLGPEATDLDNIGLDAFDLSGQPMLGRDKRPCELVRHVQPHRRAGGRLPVDDLGADTHAHDIVLWMRADSVDDTVGAYAGPRKKLALRPLLRCTERCGDLVPCP